MQVLLIIHGEHLIDPGKTLVAFGGSVKSVGAEDTDHVFRLAEFADSEVQEAGVFCPDGEGTPRIGVGDADIVFGVGYIDEITVAFKAGDGGIYVGDLERLKVMPGKLEGVFFVPESSCRINGKTALGIAVRTDTGFVLTALGTDGVAEHTGCDGGDTGHFAGRLGYKDLTRRGLCVNC